MKRLLILAIFLFCATGVFTHSIQDYSNHSWYIYLVNLCFDYDVPLRVMEAILTLENPTADPMAISDFNKNGTRDLGLFQLNDGYLYSDFISRYWHGREAFQWDNPFHNIYIAVRHVEYLYTLFAEQPTPQSRAFSVALAYNCGYGAVVSNKVPAITADYAAHVVFLVWGYPDG